MHSIVALEKSVKILVTTLLALLLLVAVGCSSSANTTAGANGPLTGNWQFTLSQQYPRPATTLSISGFLQESGSNVVGSVSVPTDPSGNCGGVVPLTGNISGQDITFSVSQNGTVLTFTGTTSYSTGAMSGTYAGPGGSCFTKPTSGTWSAFLVPSISGSFAGTLTGSMYMSNLGDTKPIPVSGTFVQGLSNGASNASVTGTITATGYPCFYTATLVGTVSGQNLILAVYSYTGEQIGALGIYSAPATITSGSSGVSVSGDLSLGSGSTGPCPGNVSDETTAQLSLSP
jgi:hypothetical protein